MIITIDGVAGAGKTTLAQFMMAEYQPRCSVQIVHMDDLYEGWVNPLGLYLGVKLREIAQAHVDHRPFSISQYDWKNSLGGALVTLLPVNLLIIEGVGSGQSSIRELVETKIWIDLEPIVGLHRVLARDGFEIEEPMLVFLEEQRLHFTEEGTRDAADFHLNGLR